MNEDKETIKKLRYAVSINLETIGSLNLDKMNLMTERYEMAQLINRQQSRIDELERKLSEVV